MNVVDVVAMLLFFGIVMYACFGGADFGVGFWDLTAGKDSHGGKLRSLIDHSIGPVWEANHVWLVFVLVYLWSGFPSGFAAIMETLWIPFSLAGLGIVLRGAAFAFRKFAPTMAYARFYGVLFATSSIVTPFFFGAIAGAIASGRVPADGQGDHWTSWTGPTSIAGGIIAVLVCAFLAAVFLTYEAAREHDEDLLRACRDRALIAAAVTGIVVFAALVPIKNDAPNLWEGLTTDALWIVIASAVAGTTTLALIGRRRFAAARVSALAAVAAVVCGWGIAQYPDMLVGTLSLDDAAGAHATLIALVATFGIAGVTVVPAIGYLFWITQQPSWSERHETSGPHELEGS
jgi:cytochrome d ubiquinol oxidase subunit II